VELEPPGAVVRSGSEALEDAFVEFEQIRQANGCVVVIRNRSPRSSPSYYAAVWGGIMSNTTFRLGAAGVITDGFVRDHYQIETIGREAGYLVFGKGNCSLDARGHLQLKGYMHSIRLPGLDVRDGLVHEVRVDQGDLIVADNDGILVIPRSIAQDVINLAVERYRAERSVISGIREQPRDKVIPFLRENGIL
jgi:regulator of RNase E activity RraA